MACLNMKKFFKKLGKNISHTFSKKRARPQRQGKLNSERPDVTETYLPADDCEHYYELNEHATNLLQYMEAPIILDCGTGSIKAGFSVERTPNCVVPTILGTPRKGLISGTSRRSVYVGESLRQMRGILTYQYPMERGIITDWNAMENIIEYCFDQKLGIEPSQHAMLITEMPSNTRANRERFTQILFEKFHVPSMCMALNAILSLYSIGMLTGLTLDSGEGVTNIVPVIGGQVVHRGIRAMDVAGKDLSEYMLTLVNSSGNFLCSTAERELVREIKEEMCYVSQNFQDDLNHYNNSSHSLGAPFKLPDGNLIYLGPERFRCPETLFDPNIIGLKCGGIHTNIYESIISCNKQSHEALLNQIVLTGGNTLFRGIESRLLKELNQLLPETTINIVARPERIFDVWKGGAILASLSTFSNMCVTGDEYFEIGPSVIHKKCL